MKTTTPLNQYQQANAAMRIDGYYEPPRDAKDVPARFEAAREKALAQMRAAVAHVEGMSIEQFLAGRRYKMPPVSEHATPPKPHADLMAEIAALEHELEQARSIIGSLHSALNDASSVVDKGDDEDYAYQAELESGKAFLEEARVRGQAGAGDPGGSAGLSAARLASMRSFSDQDLVDALVLRDCAVVALLPEDLWHGGRADTPEASAALVTQLSPEAIQEALTPALWAEVDKQLHRLQAQQQSASPDRPRGS